LLLSSAVVSIAGAIISAYFYLKEKAPETFKMTADESPSAGSVAGSTDTTFYFIAIFAVASIVFLSAAIFIWKRKGSLDMVMSEMKKDIDVADR